MTSPYRMPGAIASTWFRTSDGANALRISDIIWVCFYESRKNEALPCTVMFKNGKELCMNKADGTSLLELLND